MPGKSSWSTVCLLLMFLSLPAQRGELSGSVQLEGAVGLRLRAPGDLGDGWLQGESGQTRRQGAELEELVLQFHPRARSLRRHRDARAASAESASDKPSKSCIYQYPKKKQVDALLSNMMNELTKIFVRAREVLELESGSTVRAAVARFRGVESGDGRVKAALSAKPSSRFHVVSSKNSEYFDVIYSNMTDEYRNFYTEVAAGNDSLRSKQDPCKNQKEIKELWQDLLHSSLTSLKRAALRCVKLYLRTTGHARDSKAKNKLGVFLVKEFRKLRSYQLDTLCDLFKMCYKELLENKS